jgi:hypothetical protein
VTVLPALTRPLVLAVRFETAASGVMVVGIILIIAIAILAIVWTNKQKEARRQELRALAESWCGDFDARNDAGMERRFAQLECLRNGDRRYAYNVIEAPRGNRSICAFDYHYTTTSTDSKGRRQTHHHHFSCLVLETDWMLKELKIRKEGFFDKVADWFGGGDIDFESAHFSRTFHVKSKDRRWAFDVIHQKTMEMLLQAPRFSIELDGHYASAWRGSRFSPEDFEYALLLLEGILDGIPDDVREAGGG